MHPHHLASTTHTVEMEQMAELSSGLRERDPSQPISASALGLQGTELISGSDDEGSTLPGDAVLAGVSFDGPPEFPYVHADFRSASDEKLLKVDLHTDALRELSHLLHFQHTWGAGSGDTDPRL